MSSRITPQMHANVTGKMLSLLSVDGGIYTGPFPLPDVPTTLRFRLGPPKPTGMDVTDILFTVRPKRIVITGDSHPMVGTAGGLISDHGHGVGWFGRRQGEDYLAEKFLRTGYHPVIGREWLEEWVQDVENDEGSYKGTPERVQLAHAVLEQARNGNEHDTDQFATYEAFRGFLVDDLGVRDLEDEGCGYDPASQGWLAAIQQRFTECYAAMFSGTEHQQRGAVEYGFWVQYQPSPGEERVVMLSMMGHLALCSVAFLRHLPPGAPYVAEELARRGLRSESP